MKKLIVSENVEIVLDGKKFLLEVGDVIIINEGWAQTRHEEVAIYALDLVKAQEEGNFIDFSKESMRELLRQKVGEVFDKYKEEGKIGRVNRENFIEDAFHMAIVQAHNEMEKSDWKTMPATSNDRKVRIGGKTAEQSKVELDNERNKWRTNMEREFRP